MATRPIGPGPGAYRLPTLTGYNLHDPTKTRYPMYSFGGTCGGMNVRKVGPGPCYKVDRFTREGPMFAPAWSFGSRFPQRSYFKTPGPGAHMPERYPPVKSPRAPAYSLGARLGYQAKSRGPAPNAYDIKVGAMGTAGIMGSGTPKWTMGYAVTRTIKPISPGPAVYYQKEQDKYKTRAPLYSLGARLERAGRLTKTPGPAAYPNVSNNLYNPKKTVPAYSFGTKHSPYAPPMIIKEDTMDCL